MFPQMSRMFWCRSLLSGNRNCNGHSLKQYYSGKLTSISSNTAVNIGVAQRNLCQLFSQNSYLQRSGLRTHQFQHSRCNRSTHSIKTTTLWQRHSGGSPIWSRNLCKHTAGRTGNSDKPTDIFRLLALAKPERWRLTGK